MRNLIENFTNQIKEALEIGANVKLSSSINPIQNVLICGLGGSGIGGSLVQNLTLKNTSVPISVHKSYELPSFVSKNTLVIISSYSGNTEETVACLESALELKCKIVCISSGGIIEKISEQNNLDFIKIPGGHPPRACLGYSSVQLFFVLNFFEIIDSTFKNELEKTIQLLVSENTAIQKEAKVLAEMLINKLPILYAADNIEAVAVRIRQQLNENSKILCWHNVVPEMNHNELVGWRIKEENQVVLFLRNQTDLPRIQARMELNKQTISQYAGKVYDIWSKGESDIQRAFYLINLGDWLSLYLSELRNVDVTEVNVIDFLKGELAKETNV